MPGAGACGPRSQGEHGMGDWIELTADDGHRLKAWRARPERPRGGVLVLQEIFGVNSHMREVTEDFAAQGFDAIAPALFDRAERDVELGYAAADVTRGRALRGARVPGAAQGARSPGRLLPVLHFLYDCSIFPWCKFTTFA